MVLGIFSCQPNCVYVRSDILLVLHWLHVQHLVMFTVFVCEQQGSYVTSHHHQEAAERQPMSFAEFEEQRREKELQRQSFSVMSRKGKSKVEKSRTEKKHVRVPAQYCSYYVRSCFSLMSIEYYKCVCNIAQCKDACSLILQLVIVSLKQITLLVFESLHLLGARLKAMNW